MNRIKTQAYTAGTDYNTVSNNEPIMRGGVIRVNCDVGVSGEYILKGTAAVTAREAKAFYDHAERVEELRAAVEKAK